MFRNFCILTLKTVAVILITIWNIGAISSFLHDYYDEFNKYGWKAIWYFDSYESGRNAALWPQRYYQANYGPWKGWSEEEVKNGQILKQAWEYRKKATISYLEFENNNSDSSFKEFQKNISMAAECGAKVLDSVLDKVHPQMKEPFKKYFLQGARLLSEYSDEDHLWAGWAYDSLFVKWLAVHENESPYL